MYEYLFLELPHTKKLRGKVADLDADNVHQISQILTEMSRQGWECVTFSQSFTGAGAHYAPKFLLRRPLTGG